MKNLSIYFRNQVNCYVLFLVGRVGSTYLNSMLDSHPHIYAMGEKSRDFRDMGIEDQITITKELLTPPFIGRNKSIGFNAKLAHIKDLKGFAKLLNQKACKVIYLKRSNRVKAVVSFLNGKRLKEKTGMWGLFNESDRLSSFTVDLDEFDEALNRREKLDLELDDYVSGLQSPKLYLSYEDMLQGEDLILNSIFSYLNVESRPVTGITKKITSDDLRNVIQNFDELRVKYIGTQYEPMFDEVLVP